MSSKNAKSGKRRNKKNVDDVAHKRERPKKDPDEKNAASSEVYRTDLIQSIRNEVQLVEGDAPLIPVQDKWKEEWNHGVQVCVNDRVDPPPSLQPVDNPYPEDYCMPTNRVVCYPNNHWEDDKDYEMTTVPPRMYYSSGEVDASWVKLVNEKRRAKRLPQITIENVYEVLNMLEFECYQNTHFELLQPLRNIEIDDEDAACDVCRGKESDPDDEIVFCDGCNLSVHQSCYGLLSIPSHDWLCTCCALRYGKQTRCVLCPNLGGAMKCTADGTLWAHVACALWMPEVRFIDVDRREPISNINDIRRERLQMRCSVCDLKEGACIQCTAKNCHTSFHVVCGYRANLTLRIDNDAEDVDGVRMVALCRKHSALEAKHGSVGLRSIENSTEPEGSEDGKPDNVALDELERYFPLYVSIDKVIEKTKLDSDVVKDIAAFWMCKRKANDRKPLIREPVGIDVSENVRSDCHPSTLDQKIQRIIAQRGNMERARNLCYQLGQREKKKNALIQNRIDVFDKTMEMLTKPTIPFNMRSLRKMGLFPRLSSLEPSTNTSATMTPVASQTSLAAVLPPAPPAFLLPVTPSTSSASSEIPEKAEEKEEVENAKTPRSRKRPFRKAFSPPKETKNPTSVERKRRAKSTVPTKEEPVEEPDVTTRVLRSGGLRSPPPLPLASPPKSPGKGPKLKTRNGLISPPRNSLPQIVSASPLKLHRGEYVSPRNGVMLKNTVIVSPGHRSKISPSQGSIPLRRTARRSAGTPLSPPMLSPRSGRKHSMDLKSSPNKKRPDITPSRRVLRQKLINGN
ncbi:hypothetical protein QR680_012235 [Steinernema hermaphroditum]|uniref:PHD-type domain-containing protein n=1 Tax=Steinernema hermaphroditum TaxID=289476 RepID=A0AA39I1D2_9BILA|nr:hypothetical protein QR680_012235 [Steinernema hermaphroditum]